MEFEISILFYFPTHKGPPRKDRLGVRTLRPIEYRIHVHHPAKSLNRIFRKKRAVPNLSLCFAHHRCTQLVVKKYHFGDKALNEPQNEKETVILKFLNTILGNYSSNIVQPALRFD